MNSGPIESTETAPLRAAPEFGLAHQLARLPGSLTLAVALVVPLLLFAISAAQQWWTVRAEAQERLEHSRDLLRAHILRVLLSEQQLAATVRERILPLPEDEIAASADLHEFLRRIAAQFPEVRAIRILGASGQALASSAAFPAVAPSPAERPFFQSLSGGSAPVSVSGRYPGTAGQGTLFSIAIAVRDPSGAFAHSVVLDIDSGYFQQLYREVPGGTFQLIREDGALLVHLPGEDQAPATLPSDAFPMRQMRSQDRGTVEGQEDGRSMLLAYSRLGSYPMFLSYSIGADGLRGLWFRQLAQQALYFIPATAILAWAAWSAARTQRRLEETIGELATVNAGLEARIEERTGELRRALEDKDVLIQEVHHRVKNNMQVISSLVGLQTRMGDSAEQTTRRIHAMALVHELIYGSGSLEGLDLAHFIQRLADTLRPLAPRTVALELKLDPVRIPLERAVPVALVLNEQISRLLLNAFDPAAGGKLRIGLALDEETVRVDIVPEGQIEGGHRAEGLAGRLIEGLVAQIQGSIAQAEDGGSVTVTFPRTRVQRAAA